MDSRYGTLHLFVVALQVTQHKRWLGVSLQVNAGHKCRSNWPREWGELGYCTIISTQSNNTAIRLTNSATCIQLLWRYPLLYSQKDLVDSYKRVFNVQPGAKAKINYTGRRVIKSSAAIISSYPNSRTRYRNLKDTWGYFVPCAPFIVTMFSSKGEDFRK